MPIILGLAVGVLVGPALLFFQVYGGVSLRSPTFVQLLLFVLFLQLSVAIHELAHLVAGWFTGFRCRGVTVCCYSLLRTIRGWRFGFRWKNMLAGGGAYMGARHSNLNNRQLGLMSVSGPAASVVLLAAVAALPLPHWAVGARWPACLAAGLTAAVALLPIGTSLAVSDTEMVIMQLRGGPAWNRWRTVLLTNSLNLKGVRPREWDARGLEEAASIPGGRVVGRYKANLLAYIAACDRDEVANAAQFLEAMLAFSNKVAQPDRNQIFTEAAFFQAWRRRDAITARAWLSNLGPAKGVPEESIATAEAALLLLEGRCAEAAKNASSALERWQDRHVDAATVRQTVEELKEILRQAASCDRAGASTGTA